MLAHLEDMRDQRLSELIIKFQAYARGMLARRSYKKRFLKRDAWEIIHRYCRQLLRLRKWEWWRLFTKVKPLLQVLYSIVVTSV